MDANHIWKKVQIRIDLIHNYRFVSMFLSFYCTLIKIKITFMKKKIPSLLLLGMHIQLYSHPAQMFKCSRFQSSLTANVWILINFRCKAQFDHTFYAWKNAISITITRANKPTVLKYDWLLWQSRPDWLLTLVRGTFIALDV